MKDHVIIVEPDTYAAEGIVVHIGEIMDGSRIDLVPAILRLPLTWRYSVGRVVR